MRTKRWIAIGLVVALAGGAALASACGGTRQGTDAGTTPDVVVRLQAQNVKFVPDVVDVPANKLVRIDFENGDAGTEHDFQVDGLRVELVGSGHSGMHGGAGDGVLFAHTMPKGRASVLFRTRQTGTFTVFCTLPGHREAGMVGTLRVT